MNIQQQNLRFFSTPYTVGSANEGIAQMLLVASTFFGSQFPGLTITDPGLLPGVPFTSSALPLQTPNLDLMIGRSSLQAGQPIVPIDLSIRSIDYCVSLSLVLNSGGAVMKQANSLPLPIQGSLSGATIHPMAVASGTGLLGYACLPNETSINPDGSITPRELVNKAVSANIPCASNPQSINVRWNLPFSAQSSKINGVGHVIAFPDIEVDSTIATDIDNFLNANGRSAIWVLEVTSKYDYDVDPGPNALESSFVIIPGMPQTSLVFPLNLFAPLGNSYRGVLGSGNTLMGGMIAIPLSAITPNPVDYTINKSVDYVSPSGGAFDLSIITKIGFLEIPLTTGMYL